MFRPIERGKGKEKGGGGGGGGGRAAGVELEGDPRLPSSPSLEKIIIMYNIKM